MSEQPSTPRRSVAFATAALIVSLAAFAAAFYVYDGVDVVQSALSGELFAAQPVAPRDETPATTPRSQEPSLALPPGMTREFALGMWRDQAGTQETIRDLIEGDIASLGIVGVEQRGSESVLNAIVKYKDGTSAPGIIVMQRLGGNWYVAFTEASLGDESPIRPTGPLPSMSDIDLPLLNTMIAEQYKSKTVTLDYALGNVKSVEVRSITRGPDTATIELDMVEKQGVAKARVIAIKSDIDGNPVWLLARFTKTKDHD